MSSSSSYVQVPPQSSGKKIATEYRTELRLYSLETNSIGVGSTLIGVQSGSMAKISGLELDFEETKTGVLYLKDTTGPFVENENVFIDNVKIGKVEYRTGHETNYDIQKVILTDPNNLSYNQKIDRFGASVNTFTDGSPRFGPFGTLMVGEPITIRDYMFTYGSHDTDFWDQFGGNGAVTWDRQAVSSLLTTGTAQGDLASRTSNYYHEYSPGTGSLVEMTTQLGDKGKENVVRRWGYFDQENGFFWELDGEDLYVVIRSNSRDNNVVRERRFHQNDWNTDKLNGSNSINFDLNTSKGNIYWIDFQWLGAGRVRFGVIEPSGERLTAHVVENANVSELYPYTKTATLPVRWEQFNKGPVASSSEMRVACAVVKNTEKSVRVGDKRTADTGIHTITQEEGEVVIGAVRPALQFNGEVNRAKMRVKSVNIANMSADSYIQIRTYTTLSQVLEAVGANFVPISDESAFEYNSNKVSHVAEHSRQRVSFIAGPGSVDHHQEVSDDLDTKVELFLSANGMTQYAFFVTAKVLKGSTSDIYMSLNWEESKR